MTRTEQMAADPQFPDQGFLGRHPFLLGLWLVRQQARRLLGAPRPA